MKKTKILTLNLLFVAACVGNSEQGNLYENSKVSESLEYKLKSYFHQTKSNADLRKYGCGATAVSETQFVTIYHCSSSTGNLSVISINGILRDAEMTRCQLWPSPVPEVKEDGWCLYELYDDQEVFYDWAPVSNIQVNYKGTQLVSIGHGGKNLWDVENVIAYPRSVGLSVKTDFTSINPGDSGSGIFLGGKLIAILSDSSGVSYPVINVVDYLNL
jgi:hypothetical protein